MNRKRTALLVGIVAAPLIAGGFVFQERATADGARLFGQVLDLVSSASSIPSVPQPCTRKLREVSSVSCRIRIAS